MVGRLSTWGSPRRLGQPQANILDAFSVVILPHFARKIDCALREFTFAFHAARIAFTSFATR